MTQYFETSTLPRVLVTAVGSLPHSDVHQAVDLILGSLQDAPHAPQLSRADLKEQMWIQFSEGLPRFCVNEETNSYYFDTSGDTTAELAQFYSGYMTVAESNPSDQFRVTAEYGKGLLTFLEALRSRGTRLGLVKVQVTGPLSFALTVTDENRRPIFYHPMFRDVAVKGMGLKAVWLLEQFKSVADRVIVFFDEPSLSAYGSSAFMGVSKTDVIESLDEVMSMVLEKGGIPGVHCCGNTDWGLLMETCARIVNFDAVDFMDTMAIYGRELNSFLERGGVLAWGAVPNTEQILQETASDVVARIRNGIGKLQAAGVDPSLVGSKMLITPACGCAGLTPEVANRVYEVLAEIERTVDHSSLY